MCECAKNEDTRVELRDLQLGYFDAISTLVDTGRYDTRDDFTVVIQPMIVDQKIPQGVSGN